MDDRHKKYYYDFGNILDGQGELTIFVPSLSTDEYDISLDYERDKECYKQHGFWPIGQFFESMKEYCDYYAMKLFDDEIPDTENFGFLFPITKEITRESLRDAVKKFGNGFIMSANIEALLSVRDNENKRIRK